MNSSALQVRMRAVFQDGFAALDIAEPIVSFDADRDAAEVRGFLEEHRLRVVGLRVDGVVQGYALRADLSSGTCADHLRSFEAAEVLAESASFSEVIGVLDRAEFCFVSILGRVGAIITRTDVEKPPMRMWIFGMISIIEMNLLRAIEDHFGATGWERNLSARRLEKAKQLQTERRRRGQEARLVDCLQLGDKAGILLREPEILAGMGFSSRREGERAVKTLESLRNHLAHAQSIVDYDWDGIVQVAGRLERILARL